MHLIGLNNTVHPNLKDQLLYVLVYSHAEEKLSNIERNEGIFPSREEKQGHNLQLWNVIQNKIEKQ